jgi:hypothetical protein
MPTNVSGARAIDWSHKYLIYLTYLAVCATNIELAKPSAIPLSAAKLSQRSGHLRLS